MHVGFWGHRGRETYPERWRQRYYRRLGIDMAMFAIKPVHGIRIMDYAGHLPRIVWDKPEEPPPFPGDPTFREQVTESMRKRLMRTGEWSPALASLRDEPSYRYTDRSPVAMKAYREWLRERHGDLATLNERWGTEYSAWEEVERIDLHQTRRRDDVGPVAGYDSSLFNRTVTGDFFAWQQSVIDDLLPGLRAGPEGVWSNPEYYSIDYVRALRELGSTGCYVWAKDMLAAARAFGRADQILGAWFGGYGFADPDYLRANPWQVVFEDMNAPMWFEGARIHSSPVPMPLVNPGWDLHAVTAPVFKEIDKLNGGLARLLLGAERRDSGICMVRPTIVPDVRGYSRWLYALEALGHQARLIQEDELIDGGLAGADMLVLSGVAALEDAHAAAIQEWVEKGGLVVADHVPGVLDKYGAERAKGALDDLFGVLERSDSSEKEENVRIQWGEIEAPVAAGDVSRAENAMGKLVPNGLPAVFYRSVGKGQSLCLNAAIGGKEMKPADTLRLVAEVLKHLDIAPPLSITTDQPHTAGLQVIRYRRKPLDLIALHRQPFPNESRGGEEWDARWNVSVPLPESAHVYDAYAGRYLGRIDGWVGLLEWGRPVLLACLPGKVIAGNITAPRDVKQGERVKIVFSFDCGEAPYAGVANVTFRKPDGDEMYVLSRNLDFKDGLVTVTWDVARNEVPGLWRVSCRDAATGVTATHTIGVVREADAGEINIAR
ncbi:MAG: beta-galactosidase [Candidatus Pacebacteria bacterium]|nr:beta-galactosidase [Candidatus Paceibacterota bacterium]